MKNRNRRFAPAFAGLAVLLAAAPAAAEGGASWRPTYDLIMMWVNFGILAFVIVKYARRPLIDFLRGQGAKAAEEIQVVEEEKRRTDQTVRETLSALEDSRKHFQQVRERIVGEGERRRQELIESARHDSSLMLERTRQQIAYQITEAQAALKNELLDKAFTVALERIPAEISAEEQEQMVERYIRESI